MNTNDPWNKTSAETLEEILQVTLEDIKEYGIETSPRGRASKEILGYQFVLEDPRHRIVGFEARDLNPFYLVGNLLWVLKQSNKLEFINYYNPKGSMFSPDGEILPAAYGKRIFDTDGINQFENVIKELKVDPDSRRALINIHMAQYDWRGYLDTSCTSDFQVFIRNGYLHMINHMRSQSAAFVMPYDIFLMTMLHEIMARELNVELGEYQHFCNSIHYFQNEEKMVDAIIKSPDYSLPMEDMPKGSNMGYIKSLLGFEGIARSEAYRAADSGLTADYKYLVKELEGYKLPDYWYFFGEVLIMKAVQYTNISSYKAIGEQVVSANNPFMKLLIQVAK